MANPMRLQLNEEFCPVSDEVFGRLRQALPSDAVEIAQSLPSSQRGQLAVFCYRRQHLHELGLNIASICERSALVGAAGASGMVIFHQSRDPKRMLGLGVGPLADQKSNAVTLASA
jgi:hypothetical protein